MINPPFIVPKNASSDATLDALSYYLTRHFGSHQAGAAFLKIAPSLPSQLFWQALHQNWSGFDALDHAAFSRVFRKQRAAWRPEYMPDQERSLFESLPDLVTVFRGQCGSRPLGLSWTLNRIVAEGFARGHRGWRNGSPVIHTAVVRKADIASVQTDRQEEELVLFEIGSTEISLCALVDDGAAQ